MIYLKGVAWKLSYCRIFITKLKVRTVKMARKFFPQGLGYAISKFCNEIMRLMGFRLVN